MATTKKTNAKKTPKTTKPTAQGRASGAKQTQPAAERGIHREVIGVLLFCLAVLVMYFLLTDPKTGLGASIVYAARGMAGALCYLVPLLIAWFAVLIAFSGRERSMKAGRVALISVLILLFMALVHVFSAEQIMRSERLYTYENFLTASFRYQAGGAGLLGAILCWPLDRALGMVGAAMVLISLIIADLILMRKISLRKIGEHAREHYDEFRVQQQERSVQRMEERERRRQAQIPTVSIRPGDDMFADKPELHSVEKWLAPVAEEARREKRREQHVEKITPRDPLPGEPKVPEVAPAFEEDIPTFLSSRKKTREKPGKLHIKEPEPLPKIVPEPEPAAPVPDGSEIAEDAANDARVRKGQAQWDIDHMQWETVSFFDGGDAQDQAIERFMTDPDEANNATLPETAAPDILLNDDAAPAAASNDVPAPDDAPPFDPTDMTIEPVLPEQATKKKSVKLPIAKPAPPEDAPYVYPPIDLLAPSTPSKLKNQNERDIEKGKKLIETLASFGITARMIGIAHGPTVTRFELTPAAGIKVSRITSLADDIALNLAAISVRIEAPIPGKAAIGVEVPNDTIEVVPIRDVLESPECRRMASRLAVALGRDNAGRYIIADLAKMPHVLIAGQTGSGKSVCINSIICSILYRATPDEVRLIMIDPKVVELSVYNGIPHLLVPVVTDPKKAAGALDWAVNEMTQRYKKFAELGVRDMKGYNMHHPPEELSMPQIVIIIDELADLMMVTPHEVEDSICRLAQLARAAGIHLVIATQRPSVNVITGVIKANIPSRIAFTVASQVDSRTILDGAGAEKLLGRGDMLYAPSGQGKTRVQGTWVSDDEVHEVVNFIKVRHDASYDSDAQEHIDMSEMSDAEREETLDAFDELLPSAVELVVDAGQASVSMLQRRLRVGHSRAGRLIDEMEVRGIVGPDEGAKARKVLMTREQYRNMFP